MLLVPCLECYTAVRIIGEPEQVDALVGKDSEFWPKKYICVACGEKCEGIEEHEASGEALAKMKMRELRAAEMYAAQMGLGTPEEMVCSATEVRELFKKTVKKVKGHNVLGTTRFCIEEIEFEDGVTMFFGASSHGAIVYRISRPVSYTERALEETAG